MTFVSLISFCFCGGHIFGENGIIKRTGNDTVKIIILKATGCEPHCSVGPCNSSMTEVEGGQGGMED